MEGNSESARQALGQISDQFRVAEGWYRGHPLRPGFWRPLLDEPSRPGHEVVGEGAAGILGLAHLVTPSAVVVAAQGKALPQS